tara:strand:- start:94 stop:309 length:216 start_codon:yes stop_codon:yes gene_type:complete
MQGLITSGVFVFSLMVLMGSVNEAVVGRYQLHNNEEHHYLLFDAVNGDVKYGDRESPKSNKGFCFDMINFK